MNYLALRYFLELAKHLNFSIASQKLHISQPGLSQQISALEKELGFKLLHRTTRKVSLTEAGEYLYKKLNHSFANIEETMREITRNSAVPHTVLKIATVPSAASVYLPKLLNALHRDFPGTEFYLQETTSNEAVELLKEQHCHIAFIRTPVDLTLLATHDLKTIELMRYRLQLVVAANHRLASKKTVNLSELKNEHFIHYDPRRSPALYFLLERACVTAGFIPNTLCVGPEILTMANLIAHGLGVTIMPQDMVALLEPKKVVAIDIANEQLESSISAVWHGASYFPPAMHGLLQMLNDTDDSTPMTADNT